MKRCNTSEIESDKTFDNNIQLLANNSDTSTLIYCEDFCKKIYEAELERENSILQQASNMQAAFSFITAGLFVVAQIVVENKGENLSYLMIIWCFIIISFFLALSLVFATLAQSRFKKDKGYPSIRKLINHLQNENNKLNNEKTRLSFSITEYDGFYESLKKVNEKRVKFVKLSMYMFYIALFLCLICTLLMLYFDQS